MLVLLALPVLGLRLGFSDEGNYPEDTTTRKAYDLLADGLGRGSTDRWCSPRWSPTISTPPR